MTYEAFVLTPESRAQILAHYPPKHPNVIAHHVTHAFGVKEGHSVGTLINKIKLEYGLLYTPIKVLGHVFNGGVQAVIVEVVGAERRPDGKRYHITISIDQDRGYKPADSNKLIADVGENFEREDQTFVAGTFEYI